MFSSYRALLWKNFKFRTRTLVATALVILFPIGGAALLFGIKKLAEDSNTFASQKISPIVPTTPVKPPTFGDYMDQYYLPQTCDGNGGLLNYNKKLANPFLVCNKDQCAGKALGASAKGACSWGKLVIAPGSSTSAIQNRLADSFATFVSQQYPVTTSAPGFLPASYKVVERMADQNAVDDYVESANYADSQPVAFAVVFHSSDATTLQYSLRQNATYYSNIDKFVRPNIITTPQTKTNFKNFLKSPFNSCEPSMGGGPHKDNTKCLDLYIWNGVLSMQRTVNDFALGPSTVSVGGVGFVQFPSLEYTEEGFWGEISQFVPLFYLIGMIFPVIWTTKIVIFEKEELLVLLLKTLGVPQATITFSHFTSFNLLYIFPAVISALISYFIFSYSDFLPLLILLVLFWIGTINFCLFIASLFTRARIGSIFAVLAYVAGYFMTFAQSIEDGSKALLLILSMHPLGAFSYAITTVAKYEDESVGLTWTNSNVSPWDSGYTFLNGIYFSIFSAVLLWVGAWYFERVLTHPRKRFYFFVYPSYWFPNSSCARDSSSSDAAAQDSPSRSLDPAFAEAFEATDAHSESIKMLNLTKKRKGAPRPAVDLLSLSAYSGHVTTILGHNGAGKTSTFSMLTGQLQPSSGDAYLNGVSVTRNPAKALKDIGYCPQKDILFPYLTVKENLQVFGQIKGVYNTNRRSEAKIIINEAMSDVALQEKRHTIARNLSGGQKRKLCIAIAFSGNSNIVLLDEPTSGMDVYSRRFSWKLIRRKRAQGVAVLLSTHFLDEADVLSDRIAILSAGVLQCVGSSMFLKRAYGVGYQLTVQRSSSEKVDPISFLLGRFPEGKLLTNSGSEITVELPTTSQPNFPPFLNELEAMRKNGEIVTYGVGVTTLESVFIMIDERSSKLPVATPSEDAQNDASMVEVSLAEGTKRHGKVAPAPPQAADDVEIDIVLPTASMASSELRSASTPPNTELSGRSSFCRHFGALFRKRIYNMKRDKWAFLFSNVLPLFFAAMGFLAALLGNSLKTMPPLTLSIAPQNPKIGQSPVYFNGVNDPLSTFSCNSPTTCAWSSTATASITSPCAQSIFPVTSSQCTLASPPVSLVAPYLPTDATPVVSSGIQTVADASSLLQSTRGLYKASRYGAIFMNYQNASIATPPAQSYTSILDSNCLANTANSDPACSSYFGVGYTVAVNFTSMHASPVYQTVADNIMQQFRTSTNPDTAGTIETTIDPLPFTKKEKDIAASSDAFTSWFLIVFSFPFFAASWIAFTVRERQSGSKYLQKISGVGTVSYWLSTLAYDMCNYAVTVGIIIGLMFAFNATGLTTTQYDTVQGIITVLLLFGPAGAGFAYVTSLFFTSPTSAQGFVIVFNFVVAVAGAMTCLILEYINYDNPANNTAVIVAWCLRWIPAFNLGHGVLFAINAINVDYTVKTVFESELILFDVIMLAVEALVYVGLVILLDYFDAFLYIKKCKERLSCNRAKPDEDNFSAEGESERLITKDVEVEEERENAIVAMSDVDRLKSCGGIVALDLEKKYSNGTKAVKSVSLNLQTEVFGLLGTNGAGKTSTIKMVVGDEPISDGKLWVNGFNASNELTGVRKSLGYCPQFDAHFDNMTGREHLRFYGAVKGISDVENAVNMSLAAVDLSPADADKLAKKYSGGMKRKLSFAIATIANPAVVMLDEPSTGMDPVARRRMWNIITRQAEATKSTMVLTTHSMEEAEALCGRVTIMVGGEMRCLGSTQRLKDRYGTGYQVIAKLAAMGAGEEEFEKLMASANDFFKKGEDAAVIPPNEENVKIFVEKFGFEGLFDDMNRKGNVEGRMLLESCKSASGCSITELVTFAAEEVSANHFVNSFKQKFPSSEIIERCNGTVRLQASKDVVENIGELFEAMERYKNGGDGVREGLVKDYTVSQTTLEDVFRRFAGAKMYEEE